ncbi:unnamed protein product [Arctia plantaginis]|uniref:Uncharacterized protein n=1 Tax=Arctia plantaginis TaxID=874455 RepID=A0A8S0ZHN4_ARCPL|nr:unnamed protein product [Arctia plantaginis]
MAIATATTSGHCQLKRQMRYHPLSACLILIRAWIESWDASNLNQRKKIELCELTMQTQISPTDSSTRIYYSSFCNHLVGARKIFILYPDAHTL